MNTIRTSQLALFLVAGLVLPAAAQAPPSELPPASAGGETIDVEIKIVPFFAVDEQGKPVFDLRQDEIELRVEGKAVAIDTFDAFPRAGTVPASGAVGPASPGKSAASHPTAPRRHVVLFFDTAFSRVDGFQKAQKLAEEMVQSAADKDYLYLLNHDFKSGLKQQAGPVVANADGKAKLIKQIRALKPEVGHLDADATSNMDLGGLGTGRNNVPAAQMSPITMALKTNSQAQLEGTARSLAESLEIVAAQFQRIKEPKLLVFLSQGIDPTLYWVGSDVHLQFGTTSSSWNHIKSYQYRGIHQLYEKPLRELADSGSMSLFVNLDDKGGANGYLDSSMQHMALNSGGLYLGGADSAQMAARIARSTAAYYEAGFYLSSAPQLPSRAKIELAVTRPGVRTWSAGSLKTRETWRGLSEEARRLLIVELVEGRPATHRKSPPVRLDLRDLPGQHPRALGVGQDPAALRGGLAPGAGRPRGRSLQRGSGAHEPRRRAQSPALRPSGQHARAQRRLDRSRGPRKGDVRVGDRGGRAGFRPHLVPPPSVARPASQVVNAPAGSAGILPALSWPRAGWKPAVPARAMAHPD